MQNHIERYTSAYRCVRSSQHIKIIKKTISVNSFHRTPGKEKKSGETERQ